MLIAAASSKHEKHHTPKQLFTSINPNACFSVSPGEPTAITLVNETKMRHYNHPINKFLRNVNDFCFITMVKATNIKGNYTT